MGSRHPHRSPFIQPDARAAMDDWRTLHSDFTAIAVEEAQQSPNCTATAYGLYEGTDKFGNWLIEAEYGELLVARFELTATKAGLALGTPNGVRPVNLWLHRLSMYLEENHSYYFLRVPGGNPTIYDLYFASAMYCARVETESLEHTVNSSSKSTSPDDPAVLPSLPLVQFGAVVIDEVSRRKAIRRAYIEPLLLKRGWSVFDWANESEV